VALVSRGGGHGLNYGWDLMEGSGCFGPPGCDPTGFEPPAYEYPHSEGCSITGGYVYRGCRLPGYHGTYFFGDYCEGWVRSFGYRGSVIAPREVVEWTSGPGGFPALSFTLASFGEDGEGEVYVLELAGPGRVFRIEPDPGP